METRFVVGGKTRLKSKEWIKEHNSRMLYYSELFGNKELLIKGYLNPGKDIHVSNGLDYGFINSDCLDLKYTRHSKLNDEVFKFAEYLISKYPRLSCSDIGPGGVTSNHYNTEEVLMFAIENKQTKILLPFACGSNIWTMDEIKQAIESPNRELNYEFKAGFSHFRKIITFLTK